MGIPIIVINLGKFVVQSACRAIPRWRKPLLIHDNLPLDKGVEKGGCHDKTRSACNSKNVLIVLGHLILTFASFM